MCMVFSVKTKTLWKYGEICVMSVVDSRKRSYAICPSHHGAELLSDWVIYWNLQVGEMKKELVDLQPKLEMAKVENTRMMEVREGKLKVQNVTRPPCFCSSMTGCSWRSYSQCDACDKILHYISN